MQSFEKKERKTKGKIITRDWLGWGEDPDLWRKGACLREKKTRQ